MKLSTARSVSGIGRQVDEFSSTQALQSSSEFRCQTKLVIYIGRTSRFVDVTGIFATAKCESIRTLDEKSSTLGTVVTS